MKKYEPADEHFTITWGADLLSGEKFVSKKAVAPHIKGLRHVDLIEFVVTKKSDKCPPPLPRKGNLPQLPRPWLIDVRSLPKSLNPQI